MNKKAARIIFYPGYTALGGYLPIEDYTNIARTAAACGFTHVDLGSAMVSRSRYQLPNNGKYCEGYDFYPEYTATFVDSFKFYCPEKLREFLPQDYIRENQEELRARSTILEELGLKGSLIGATPQWLPEAVYAKHPDWRGPRCDMPFRSRKAYFSPCVDNPEVLELYHEASHGIGKVAPVLDTLIFMTNDSGTTFCWNRNSYPGENGPAHCQDRSMQERVNAFVAAQASGLKTTKPLVFHTYMGLWCFAGKLPPHEGMECNENIYFVRPPQDKPVAFENPLALLEQLEKAGQQGADTIVVNIEQPRFMLKDGRVYAEILKKFWGKPSFGITARINFLRNLVHDCGWEDTAHDHLLDAWQALYRAIDDTSLGRLFYYSVFLYGCMSARLLVRPFLPLPQKLSEADKEYYKKHVFDSSDNPDHEFDLLNIHGSRNVFLGRTAEEAERSVLCWNAILQSLRQSIQSLELALLQASREQVHYLQDTRRRVQALVCFAENLRNACEFQALLDHAKATGYSSRANSEKLEVVMRRELDNTQKLILLLEEKGFEELLPTAAGPADETTFMFGPDLLEQLQKKRELMLHHWHDSQVLFEFKNRFNQI